MVAGVQRCSGLSVLGIWWDRDYKVLLMGLASKFPKLSGSWNAKGLVFIFEKFAIVPPGMGV